MNKKTKKLYIKLIILILCFFIVLRIFVLVLSKYESESSSNANVDIAFYLLKEDYKTMTLNLDSMLPRDNAYIYNFSIGNIDNEKQAEVDLTYDLTIRTTTNLPITYELLIKQENSEDWINAIKSNDIAKDEDGTYFRTISTEQITLKYKDPTTNLYQLVVYFPSNYNESNYQDIIEAIEINVYSTQITE